MADLATSIRKWALKNAHDYKLAIPAKVIGRVLAECPEAKADMKGTMALINEEAKRVNALSHEAVEKELAEFAFEEKKAEEGEKKLELPNAVQGNVVTRFPPEPSGFPHIGHAKAAFLNFEAAKQYGGHMRLRFDDTNPEKEKEEFTGAIIDGLKWLGISWGGEITYTSDYMERMYEYADEMILKQKAYVCTCIGEDVKKGRQEGKECLCRTKMAEDNIVEWRTMISGKLEEGAAVLRFRGNMKAENTAMRDPTLFRIIKAPHYRQGEKYKCWPSYDFVAPILDSVEGVTHAMRSKEYELRDELYFAVLKILDLRKPVLIGFSRLNIAGAPVSKRLITPLIAEGKVSGYDDPRLPTLAALRRRGIQPEAIRKFVLQFGLSKVESEPGWGKLLNENKKIIDPASMRRFFVATPCAVQVERFSPRIVELKNHPQKEELGKRQVLVQPPFYVPSKDADALADGELFRLKDLCNVKVKEKAPGMIIAEYVEDEGAAAKKMQWVCESAKLDAEVMVVGDLLLDGKFNPDSMKIVTGVCEKACEQMQIGDIVQFERFGFVRLDAKTEGKLKFILTGE